MFKTLQGSYRKKMERQRHVYGECKRASVVLIICLLSLGHAVEAAAKRVVVLPTLPATVRRRQLLAAMDEPAVNLNYYYGPLLSGPDPVPVYVIWYGSFSNSQRAIVQDFLSSFDTSKFVGEQVKYPTVRGWWSLTAGYVDAKGNGVESLVYLAGELDDPYSLGKSLTEDDVEQLVLNSTSKGIFPANFSAAYFVLISADVAVESFCMNACGSHSSTYPSRITAGQQLPYAWVGNSATQCPGLCAWPYAQAQYGPPLVLTPPNGDVGMDGLIINLAALLAGIATNPYNTGYYQGDALSPFEAATACTGIYGPNAYAGDPGLLFVNAATNGSFNAVGVSGREFLLPALWLPSNQSCTPPPYI